MSRKSCSDILLALMEWPSMTQKDLLRKCTGCAYSTQYEILGFMKRHRLVSADTYVGEVHYTLTVQGIEVAKNIGHIRDTLSEVLDAGTQRKVQ